MSGKFQPKEKVDLDPPLDTPYTVEELAQYDGVQNPKVYVAIKGVIFDVTRNTASYGPGKGYNVFVGKDASRALAKSSLKVEDAIAKYDDLPEKELKVLDDWFTFFSNRYNIVGRVVQ
ncbi:hypothetical protein DV495_004542 [Geotrichum candidum]|nr:hypothetical protein DV454_003686 [Geotrichum candidum]KAF5120481.1 hypothetical protein DV495_004542 [Geotrichum candidum]KAI8133375.1 hypothetical protein DUD61_002983 [Geotrichum candidum]